MPIPDVAKDRHKPYSFRSLVHGARCTVFLLCLGHVLESGSPTIFDDDRLSHQQAPQIGSSVRMKGFQWRWLSASTGLARARLYSSMNPSQRVENSLGRSYNSALFMVSVDNKTKDFIFHRKKGSSGAETDGGKL